MWLLTIGFLLRNHYFYPEEIPAFENADLFTSVEAVERWRDIEEYMLILQNDVVAGASATTITKSLEPDRNLTYVMQFALSAKLSPILPPVNVKVTAGLDPEFSLTKFYGDGDIGPARLRATGKIDKEILYIKIDNNNATNIKKVELQNPVSLAEAVRPALSK